MKKYKLIKDLPDAKAGKIISSNGVDLKGDRYYFSGDTTISEKTINNNPEWFAPYLFTTEDGVDVYADEWVYVVYPDNKKIESAKFTYFTSKDESYKYFALKDFAEQYLESLKPKFKVGDVITVTSGEIKGYIAKIQFIEINNDITYAMWSNDINDQFRGVSFNCIRLATKDEIIKYYESLGWVKGAKVKWDTCIWEITHLAFKDNGDLLVMTTTDKRLGLKIKDCELIKPNYPKTWEELNITRLSNNFYTIDDSVNRLDNKDVFATESQAKSVLAFAQLTQLHKAMIDEYNRFNDCEWKPDWTKIISKFLVSRFEDYLKVGICYCEFAPLVFPTEELAEFSLEHHRELWENYYEIN